MAASAQAMLGTVFANYSQPQYYRGAVSSGAVQAPTAFTLSLQQRVIAMAPVDSSSAAAGGAGAAGNGGEKKQQQPKKIPLSPWVKVVSGMAGGLAEACSLQPMDVAKTRLQLDRSGKYRGLIHTLTTVSQEEGVRSLYKGLTPFITHLMLKYALRFGSFGALKSALPEGASPQAKAAVDFASGLGAGLIEAVLIVTPFEVVKIRLQQQRGTDKSQLKYRNPIHAVSTIVREEGMLALWKGVLPTMLRQGSNQAFNFMTFSYLNSHFFAKSDGDGKEQPVWQPFVVGFLAACVGPIMNCPLDVLKTRLMAQKTVPGEAPKYTGFMQAMKLIAREEGVLALWKGLIPRLARLAPGQAITWTVVTKVQTFFEQREAAKRVAWEAMKDQPDE